MKYHSRDIRQAMTTHWLSTESTFFDCTSPP